MTKKAGKRLTKKQLSEMLQALFTSQPDRTWGFKDI